MSKTPGSGFCSPCPVGKFASSDNTECSRCSPGTFSGIGAHGSCTSCESGKFSKDYGSDRCHLCNATLDTNGEEGRSACQCKKGFVTVSDGSCSCPPGYTLESGRCVLCAAGFYKSSTSNEACRKCNTETYVEGVKGSVTTTTLATSYLNCTCSKNEFRVPTSPKEEPAYVGQCLPCPHGADCSAGGISVEFLPLKEGYWRSSSQSHNLVQCYAKDACGHPNRTENEVLVNIDDQCAEGHTGVMCNVCLVGYAKSVTGLCEGCVSETSVPTEMIAFFLCCIFLAAAAFFLIRRRNKMKHMAKEAKLANNDALAAASMERKKKKPKKDFAKRGKTKFKILASTYQIISQFESVLSVRYPTVFEEFERAVSSFVNLDALKLTKVGCLVHTNFYHKLLLSTLGPLGFSLLIFAVMFAMKARAKTHERKQAAINLQLESFSL